MHTSDLSRYSMASPLRGRVGSGGRPGVPHSRFYRAKVLFRLAADLLAVPLAGKSLLGAALVTGFEVEAMFLDVLDDVFLLHLPLEAPEGVLYRFALLDLDLGQYVYTP